MNKKLIIAWIVVFVAWFFGSFVVHGVLLNPDYMHHRPLYSGRRARRRSTSR